MTLAATLARATDRCSLGFHLSQHPTWCSCDEMGEWAIFLVALRSSVRADRTVHVNDVRPKVRGRIEHKHIGQLWKQARRLGYIERLHREPSSDVVGGNTDKEATVYRALPALLAVAALTCLPDCLCRCDQLGCGCLFDETVASDRSTPCSLCGKPAKARVIQGVLIYRCLMCDVRRCQHCGHYIESPTVRDYCPECRGDLAKQRAPQTSG